MTTVSDLTQHEVQRHLKCRAIDRDVSQTLYIFYSINIQGQWTKISNCRGVSWKEVDTFSCLNSNIILKIYHNLTPIYWKGIIIVNANSEKTRPYCDKKSKCEDIHGVTHLQYVVYLSGNSSTYIQISPDFPRITQNANKQVNTSVRSVEKF